MARIIRVGGSSSATSWHDALNDLHADDVLMLGPGYYYLPQGRKLTDITIKGTGSLAEDTTIYGNISVSEDSRYVTLENLCVNMTTDNNSIFVPIETDGYVTLRNCCVKGYGTDTAAIAINGKVTLELYSTKVTGGSVSIYENADFRLEMNDSQIDYPSENYCALALEGHGTAIINNSNIRGSINTFTKTNAELDLNNSEVDYVLLHGQTWMNMLNSTITAKDDSCLYLSDDCWSNIVNSKFNGGIYIDKKTHTIIQNSTIDRMMVVDEAKVTMNNSIIMEHADFQDKSNCEATRVTFIGNMNYEYFLALSGKAQLNGHDLVLHPNQADLAVQDEAKLKTNVLAEQNDTLNVEYSKRPNVYILGMHWTAKKKQLNKINLVYQMQSRPIYHIMIIGIKLWGCSYGRTNVHQDP